MESLIAAGLLGFLGSAHCAAMCGGFYVLASKRRWGRSIQYALGKTVTYALLGSLAGALGASAAMFGAARSVFSITVGVLMIAGGLVWAGWLPVFVRSTTLSSRISRLLGRVLKRTGPLSPALLGLTNGLLPCGLLYGGLGIAAVTTSASHGALVMTVFGLATIPSLVVFGVVASRIGQSLSRYMRVVGGLAVIGFGLLTIYRAFSVMSHVGH
ncbi:MAG: sulfite exporter TauE/SafE family protein [Rhodothermales bacterium]|nr:sulfite exporter TauE/SafE family protein [Rhodothermales bacterium]